MGRQTQSISLDELEDISRQCASLHGDWQRFYQLAGAPAADSAQQQLALIQLQSRLSCDYPILSHWRKANFGLASGIGRLVANAGTLAAFAEEAKKGNGPLLREWQTVNESIGNVRKLLEEARQCAREGKPVKLPKEIAAPIAREPLNVVPLVRKAGIVAAVMASCVIAFFILRPFMLETALFRWLDKSYTAWQVRNGLPGAGNGEVPTLHE